MPKLPDLDNRQTKAFLNHFSRHWEHGEGSMIKGVSCTGNPYFFHAKHPAQIRRDFLLRILRLMGVSRADFEAWYTKNK